MDEIMELLSDEIDGFNKSIKKLEVLSKKWNELNIKADSSSIEFYIKEHLRKSEEIIDRYNERKGQENPRRYQKSTVYAKMAFAVGHIGINYGPNLPVIFWLPLRTIGG